MRQFKNRNLNSFWYSPLALAALFCILAVFVYNVVGLIQKERETNKNKNNVIENVDELNNREKFLTDSINKLKTEEGKEELLREKYQVVRPNEKMVVIVNNQTDTSPNISEKANHNFWAWFVGLFNK